MQDLECTQISHTTKNAYEVREATSDPEKILRCEGLPSNPTLVLNYIAKPEVPLLPKYPSITTNALTSAGGSRTGQTTYTSSTSKEVDFYGRLPA